MSKKLLTIWLIILGYLLNTLPRYLDFSPPYESEKFIRNYRIYSIGQAASFFFIILAAIIKPKDKLVSILFNSLLIAAFFNLLDEIFFNSIEFNCNDAVSFTLTFTYLIYNLYNLNKNK